jgi:transcriptional regulator with XRE-family HTH domain
MEKIKELRKAAGLSQQQLAKKAKLSQSAIAQMESGLKDPRLGTLKKIAKALKVNIAELFETSSIYVIDIKKIRKKKVLSAKEYMQVSMVARVATNAL